MCNIDPLPSCSLLPPGSRLRHFIYLTSVSGSPATQASGMDQQIHSFWFKYLVSLTDFLWS
ncbi:hypothetical protein SERLA73DRAFT_184054 [Serpula lacrymans var. lacrymans S7.3]|uniref:Uncharacterized protein n=2 Tax=Serpula lacrymans var. lacrymans TaxID=341189 RepID=F8Q2G0_SERL3|nr:uncharacterized protein SERLADRAFT_471533 [Serpula lacrymans var. lacrymans S7.9]EGN97371.1 hypothetical protein SERLA73DRAFT_184054 [Serpula lacrymans var. lacrymans S7.3]EGO22964.1 hypothetical protein SERLADRAFT_471533 [Serpula lacrymans var. lacrymans S7.9]